MKNNEKGLAEEIGLAGLVAFALLIGASPAGAQVSLGTASGYAVLSAAPAAGGAATFTDSAISGNVGSSGLPEAIVQTRSTITGAINAPAPAQASADFNRAYDALAAVPCSSTQALTGALAGITLTPGVYCFDAAAELTGVLTLKGPSSASWLFKIGTSGTGYLAGTNFSVALADGAQARHVTWRVAEYSSMTTSDFKGDILAGTAITFTGGTFNGRALAKTAVTMTSTAASVSK